MWLINTSTLQLEEFIGQNIPKYAILSHTWEDEEVSFKAFNNGTGKKLKGYEKIEMTCTIAAQVGLSYAWVDTCCIDKSSSAELTEAINSMFRWYYRAEVCYAFLADLPADAPLQTAMPKCKWFSRGWTLQETLAPRSLYLFNQSWIYVGSKQELLKPLSAITGIDASVLAGARHLSSVAVAQRMSWAAHRQTTRVEDMAYCLLGIFGINMPMLYGEEEKAFQRLQEELIKSTSDLSIFAWTRPAMAEIPKEPPTRRYCGILAKSPAEFSGCGAFRLLSTDVSEFSVSNKGVKAQFQICFSHQGFCVLPLDCRSPESKILGIKLKICGSDEYVREDPASLVDLIAPMTQPPPGQRYLKITLPNWTPFHEFRMNDTHFSIAQSRQHVLNLNVKLDDLRLADYWPRGRFDLEDMVFFVTEDTRWDCGVLQLQMHKFFNILGKVKEEKFDCMFFAMGYSAQGARNVQYSLIEFSTAESELRELRNHMIFSDLDTGSMLYKLKSLRIPKTSSVVHRIADTDHALLMSFKQTRVHDPDICCDDFWRINFTCEICQINDVREPTRRDWRDDFSS